MKIGFIGLGNMGGAVAQAVAKADNTELLLSDHNQAKAENLQAELGGQIMSNEAIADQADVIFLGVKPHLIQPLLQGLTNHIKHNAEAVWISMAAGIKIESITDYIPSHNIIRMMPNTPIKLGQGMVSFTTENKALVALFEDLLAYGGQLKYLDEHLMDAASAIAGSGPAYVYEFIESLIDAGIQNGLSFETSRLLATQTLLGASQMVLDSTTHPAELKHQVTSPAGSTIAGLVALEKNQFRYSIIEAVNQAVEKNKELGQ